MELPHQSSNTCRLAWPWNCTGQGSKRVGASPAPRLEEAGGRDNALPDTAATTPVPTSALVLLSLLRIPSHPDTRSFLLIPQPHCLALRPGSGFLAMLVHTCTHKGTESPGLFPCKRGAGLHSPGKGK